MSSESGSRATETGRPPAVIRLLQTLHSVRLSVADPSAPADIMRFGSVFSSGSVPLRDHRR